MQKVKHIQGFTINFEKKLGQGSYGKVFVGEEDLTHQKVAVKIMDRTVIDKDEYLRNAIFSQIDILKTLKSPNVVQFKAVVQSQLYYYIIQQLCDGGDLRKLIEKKAPFSEAEAIKYLTQMANGFVELIKEGVVHRDLKPENVFINSGQMKLADFGFSKKLHNKRVKNETMVGTPLYMSIEILKGIPYTSKCDIWALGLIFYELLCKVTPWDANTEYELINNIEKKPLKLPQNVSPVTKDFLTRCLKVNQKDRFSWDQLLRHQIFNGYFNSFFQLESELQNKLKSILQKIKYDLIRKNLDLERLFRMLGYTKQHQLNYEQFQNFIKTIGEASLSEEETRYFFEKIDTDDSNTISYGELVVQLEKNGVPTQANKGIQLVRSPSYQNEGANRMDNLEIKVRTTFQKLYADMEKHNYPIQNYFAKLKPVLTIQDFGGFMNQLNPFDGWQIEVLFNKLVDCSTGVTRNGLQDYFKTINGVPINRVFLQPRHSNNFMGSQYSNQQQVYSPNHQQQEHSQSPFQIVGQFISPKNQMTPPKITPYENGPKLVFNERLGIYTQIYDPKFHTDKGTGFFGFFK